jgi:SOS-response transcriptional repressor LexA
MISESHNLDNYHTAILSARGKFTARQFNLDYPWIMKASDLERLEKEVDNILILISNLIKAIPDVEGKKLNEFAAMCGVGPENITRYKGYGESTAEGGRHDPHLRTFYKILRGLLGKPPFVFDDPESQVSVPLVDGCIAANPAGLIPGDAIESYVYLPRSEFHGRYDLVAVRLAPDADSMEPTLHPGDMVIIDRKYKEITPRGIYAVRLPDQESCTIKRLQIVPGKNILILLSDNTKYAPLPIADHEHLIIGRVIYSLTNWVK